MRTIDLNARGLPWRIFDRVTNGPVHLDLRHTYDANGNVMAITDHAPGGVQGRSMAYDGLDRLTSTSAPLMFGQASYAYDPLDNLAARHCRVRPKAGQASTPPRMRVYAAELWAHKLP